MKRSRTENQEALAGIVAAIIGLVIVSNAPTELRPLAILVVIAVYFIGFVVLGYRRARRGSRE
jgi:uncharacterized membrane protein HdeD (DUF308 family)